MSDPILLARGLRLPVDIVTQTVAILAKRRAGKSYTARRFVEQLAKAGAQVVVVDPKGDWWGVRSSADGEKPGLPITILGGERGDVSLEVGAGELVAKLAVEERVSMVLDLADFRKAELATFMAGFLETLYRLKAREAHRTPLMLVIDEADAIAPQQTREKGSVPRMLGACEDIVRRGGQRGIGCTLISQRSAVLNKNVLTQAQVLVALRTIAPQDLKALDEWINVHGTPEERETLRASLPSLPIGDAWFWSPGWPDAAGIFKRVHVAPIATFDSGATPKVGEAVLEPRQLAAVDLVALKKQMAATIERQAADDPKLLRQRIRQLEKTLGQVNLNAPPDPAEVEAAVQARVKQQLGDRLAELSTDLTKAVDSTNEKIDEALEELANLTRTWAPAPPAMPPSLVHRNAPLSRSITDTAAGGVSFVASAGPESVDARLDGPMQKILDAMAWLLAARMPVPWSRVQVAYLAGYSPKSSGFKDPLSRLKTAGLVSYPEPGRVGFTQAGLAQASDVPQVPSVEQLQERILDRIDGPMGRILRPLIAAYPTNVPRYDLAKAAGYSETSSGFKDPLSRLRSLGLVDYPSSGYACATPALFLEAAL